MRKYQSAITALALLATGLYAAVLVSVQMSEHQRGIHMGTAYTTNESLFGWPTVYCCQTKRIALPSFRVEEESSLWSIWHFAINSAVILLLTSSVGYTTWRLNSFFFQQRRLISIAFLFGLLASVGAVFPLYAVLENLGNLQFNRTDWPVPAPMAWSVRFSVWLGLLCFTNTTLTSFMHGLQVYFIAPRSEG